MKVKRILFCFLFLVALGIILTSCTKKSSNGETIVPIGKEYFDVEELFSEDDLKPAFDAVMKKMGIYRIGANHESSIPSHYEDLIPQKLVGSYVMNQTMLVGSNVGNMQYPVSMPDVTIEFTSQHNSIASIEFTESSITQKTDTVFIMGNDNFNGFSAYFIEKKEFDQAYDGLTFHVKVKRGIIMCGSVTPDGLSGYEAPTGGSGFRFASIIMSWDDNSHGILPKYEPGTYMIYEEGDGLAAKSNG